MLAGSILAVHFRSEGAQKSVMFEQQHRSSSNRSKNIFSCARAVPCALLPDQRGERLHVQGAAGGRGGGVELPEGEGLARGVEAAAQGLALGAEPGVGERDEPRARPGHPELLGEVPVPGPERGGRGALLLEVPLLARARPARRLAVGHLAAEPPLPVAVVWPGDGDGSRRRALLRRRRGHGRHLQRRRGGGAQQHAFLRRRREHGKKKIRRRRSGGAQHALLRRGHGRHGRRRLVQAGAEVGEEGLEVEVDVGEGHGSAVAARQGQKRHSVTWSVLCEWREREKGGRQV